MAKINQWWHYWRENIEIARGKNDVISWLITIVFFVAGILLRTINPSRSILASISDETLGRICIWIGVAIGVWSLSWLPFRQHEIEEQKHQAAIKKLTNAKAEKAAEKLTELGEMFAARISSLKGIHPNQYNPDKDEETWVVVHLTAAYIMLRLTPEAAEIFDDGIMNTRGYSLPHHGSGSTIYEDRHREILANLNRRLLNLKRIIDKIDKYIKTIESGGPA